MNCADGFVPGARLTLQPYCAGALSGRRFAAKDLFQIKGYGTGFGNPDWLATHAPAEQTATLLEILLGSGAQLCGKTITDELAYSLVGDNLHYGAPLNPAAPERFAGGSSCGSASVVASGEVDFALGTDTAGSIRIPASHCGLFGFRPTHSVLSMAGVLPLAPGFDTVGWVARDAQTFVEVGHALLGASAPLPTGPLTLGIARSAFDRVNPTCREMLWDAAQRLAKKLQAPRVVVLEHPLALETLAATFRVLQAQAAWEQHGDWITNLRPRIAEDVAARFEWGASLQPQTVVSARVDAGRHREWIDALFDRVDILIWPTAAELAPRRGSSQEERSIYRRQVLLLTAMSSLAGLPEATLPLCRIEGAPMGVSLIARRGCDIRLLQFVQSVYCC